MEKLRDNIEHIDVARLIAEGGGKDFLINLDLHLPRKDATNLLLKGGFIIILCKGSSSRSIRGQHRSGWRCEKCDESKLSTIFVS